MTTYNSDFEEAVQRACRGEFREYWLQLYISDNYRKLGLDALQGPFETGYDFRGLYQGEKVVIEAERVPVNFVKHGHDPRKADILIVLGEDDTDRSLLPKTIIKVDPRDFVDSTHEMRKEYAIKREAEQKEFVKSLPYRMAITGIKSAFSTLYGRLVDETPLKGTPEAEAFEEAASLVTSKYLSLYSLSLEELVSNEQVFTKIEVLANELGKSRRDFEDMSDEERQFLKDWLEIFHHEYALRL